MRLAKLFGHRAPQANTHRSAMHIPTTQLLHCAVGMCCGAKSHLASAHRLAVRSFPELKVLNGTNLLEKRLQVVLRNSTGQMREEHGIRIGRFPRFSARAPLVTVFLVGPKLTTHTLLEFPSQLGRLDVLHQHPHLFGSFAGATGAGTSLRGLSYLRIGQLRPSAPGWCFRCISCPGLRMGGPGSGAMPPGRLCASARCASLA
mmetsp:Transcript_58076/g.126985  ORF Transcript_58076/g.126985 Transcript_58076/m.126985 type:complete len:203 (+) Transcript_58076:612-1220(+)